jgi:Flp pilus assembly pilin Flp
MKIKINLRKLDMRTLLREEGNGVTDLAMVVALVATGAVAGLSSVATDVNSAFSSVASAVSSMSGVMIHHM